MKRRQVLAAVGGTFPTVFAGCLSEFSDGNDDDENVDPDGVEPRELPEWPDAESAEAVTTYATEYTEVVEYNRRVEELADEDAYFENLSRSCSGAFEAETSAGYVVLASCSQTETVTEPSGETWVSNGFSGPYALLATEDAVTSALIDNFREAALEVGEPPDDRLFSTRGLVVVNFSSTAQSLEIRIEDDSDASNGADPAFTGAYDLAPETGRMAFEALDDPGRYTVSVAAEDEATHDWDVPDEPREPIEVGEAFSFDVALGVYVLPDGTVSIREIPEDRATT